MSKIDEIIKGYLKGNKSAEEANKEIEALYADLSEKERYQKFCEELSERVNPRLEALDRLMRNSMRSYSKPFGG